MSRLLKIKNILAKVILMFIGTVWLTSDVYDNIMSNFLLTDKDVPKWGTLGDYGVVMVCLGFILGGVYLNTIFKTLNALINKILLK